MLINDFLKLIISKIKETNRNITLDEIYYLLKYIDITKDITLASNIEKFFQDFLNSLNNSLIKYEARTKKYGINATHYIAFNTSEKANYKEAIKVYLPVKYKYLISALKTVFTYLIKNNIIASVKFHLKATNEAIVIRFYDKNELIPFINYCNNNYDLKELLEPLNPFIPNKYGIGFVTDDNTKSSYLNTISQLLEEYFKELNENNEIEKASDLHFLNFINKKLNLEENEEMKFNIASVLKSLNLIIKNKK